MLFIYCVPAFHLYNKFCLLDKKFKLISDQVNRVLGISLLSQLEFFVFFLRSSFKILKWY